jgi:hypothetical protein
MSCLLLYEAVLLNEIEKNQIQLVGAEIHGIEGKNAYRTEEMMLLHLSTL